MEYFERYKIARQVIAEAANKVGQKFKSVAPEMVRIDFSIKSKRILAKAYKNERISFNVRFLKEGSSEAFLDTILHEYAHIIAYEHYVIGRGMRILPHGAQWKEIAIHLECAPRASSKMAVFSSCQSRKTRKFSYFCPECETYFTLGLIRHKKALSRQVFYFCRKCAKKKSPLIFQKEVLAPS